MKNRRKKTAAAAAALMLAGLMAFPAAAAPQPACIAGARSDRELTAQTMNSTYLLPDSDTYYITEADISWMDDNELMLARNEFYARKGRKFVTKSIREYFERQGWYHGTIEPDAFSPDLFNRYEQANVDFIVAYENKRQQKKQASSQEVTVLQQLPPSTETDEYTGLTSLYADSIREDWSDEELTLSGVNSLTGELDQPADAGYLYRDLDGDGKAELLIGPSDSQLYGSGAVFEIYTIENGLPVEVASSSEDSMYYLCGDNTILREKVFSDGKWELDYYKLVDGELIYKDLLIMDESRNAANPWFIVKNAEMIWEDADPDATGTSWIPDQEYAPIEEKNAMELRASYATEPLVFTAMQ
jgi:hypothetical protein